MGFLFATKDKLDELRQNAIDEGFERGKEWANERLEANDRAIKSKNKQIKNLQEELSETEADYEKKISTLETKIEVLEDDRDDVCEVMKLKMELDDKQAVLDEIKESLDKRKAKIKERESELDSEEESNFKKGYADGIADGLREISKITQQDRDNAMKVAMVSAASHTPVENMKEINSELRLTAGSEEK